MKRLGQCAVSVAAVMLVIACAPETTSWQGETVIGVSTPPPPPPPPEPKATAAPTPPPAPPPRVVVNADRVVINEKIQFELNKATIKPDSNGLIDEIADAIKKHPELKKLRVEGHASSDGDGAANMKLSDERASAVVAALVKRGVEAKVLTAKGFGSTQPIAPNDTEEGREKNRRVDFVILEPAPPGAAAAASAKPPTTTPATSAKPPTPTPATPAKAGHP